MQKRIQMTHKQWCQPPISDSMSDLEPQPEINFVDNDLKNTDLIHFHSITSVLFHVDGAVGLPISTTATRISAVLLTADRKQIGEATLSSFSHSESDHMHPKYDLHMSWRGDEIRNQIIYR